MIQTDIVSYKGRGKKLTAKEKNTIYKYTISYCILEPVDFILGMIVSLFENPFHSHGITLTQRWDSKVVITLNARNDHDRSKFVEDLRESVAEMDEMESLRIEAELEKQHATSRVSVNSTSTSSVTVANHQNRDSGVNDCDSQESSAR